MIEFFLAFQGVERMILDLQNDFGLTVIDALQEKIKMIEDQGKN